MPNRLIEQTDLDAKIGQQINKDVFLHLKELMIVLKTRVSKQKYKKHIFCIQTPKY